MKDIVINWHANIIQGLRQTFSTLTIKKGSPDPFEQNRFNDF